jgi:hypothetical protein
MGKQAEGMREAGREQRRREGERKISSFINGTF